MERNRRRNAGTVIAFPAHGRGPRMGRDMAGRIQVGSYGSHTPARSAGAGQGDAVRDSSNRMNGSPGPRLSIVLIEDDANIREAFADLLSASGYSVVAEADGVAGIGATCRLRPDLVVTDITLPRLSGLDVARILRANAPTQHIPIIAATAEKSVPGPGEAGLFDAVLYKPFPLPDLLDAIAHAIPKVAA